MSSTSTGPRTPSLQAGESVGGKYRVVRLLGQGGMGAVYLVKHQSLGSECALKVLSKGSAMHHARFGREARILASLRSEHVAKVVDFGFVEDLDAPYMVMEYLPGSDLSQHLEASAGPLPVRDAVDHVLEACEALAEAHREGIVHRDVKPSNLFLTHRFDGSPMVKVLDFGIAKTESAPGDDASLTATTMVFGSPAYMSPEQVRSSKLVGPQTDIWSLALVLYELVSKAHPFHGDSTAGIVAAIAADSPVPLPPEIGPNLWAVLEPALRKDPRERPQSIAAFAGSLARFASERGRIVLARIERLAGRSVPPGQETARTYAMVHPATTSGSVAPKRADEPPPASARTTYGGGTRNKSMLPLAGAGLAIVAVGAWVGLRSQAAPLAEDGASALAASVEPAPSKASTELPVAIPRPIPSASAPVAAASASAAVAPASPAASATAPAKTTKPRSPTPPTPRASGGSAKPTAPSAPRQGEFD